MLNWLSKLLFKHKCCCCWNISHRISTSSLLFLSALGCLSSWFPAFPLWRPCTCIASFHFIWMHIWREGITATVSHFLTLIRHRDGWKKWVEAFPQHFSHLIVWEEGVCVVGPIITKEAADYFPSWGKDLSPSGLLSAWHIAHLGAAPASTRSLMEHLLLARKPMLRKY